MPSPYEGQSPRVRGGMGKGIELPPGLRMTGQTLCQGLRLLLAPCPKTSSATQNKKPTLPLCSVLSSP